MTSEISIERIVEKRTANLDGDLIKFLSINSGQGFDIRVHERERSGRSNQAQRAHQMSPSGSDSTEAMIRAYPEINFSRTMIVKTSDCSIAGAAKIASFLADTSGREIELIVNKVEMQVTPGMSTEQIGKEFLKGLIFDEIEIDGQSGLLIDSRCQQLGGWIGLEDCIRISMVVAEITGRNVKFNFHSVTDGVVSEFVSPESDFLDVYRRVDPLLTVR